MERAAEIKAAIRTVRDWPAPGVNFRDVTTLFQNPPLFRTAMELLAEGCRGYRPDVVAGVDARGFILAGMLAERLEVPLALVRKKGKLPYDTIEEAYELEYGKAVVEIHTDACRKGDRVIVVDDLIATGGTLLAAFRLFERLGGTIAAAVTMVDLPELGGSRKIGENGVPVVAACAFDEAE